MMRSMILPLQLYFLWLVLSIEVAHSFQVSWTPRTAERTTTALSYEPKWKKKETLAEQSGGPTKDLKEVGLVGSISVVFKQGNETKQTMALPGQPLREVAIQAGQFIKYGCGKGECGTCEALVNGQWIRPCSVSVPADLPAGVDYVVNVKSVKNKAKSSGKFYSVRSFLFGFYNNVLGMVGMVKYKRNAKKNFDDRIEYEDLIRQKTMERKLARSTSSTDVEHSATTATKTTNAAATTKQTTLAP